MKLRIKLVFLHYSQGDCVIIYNKVEISKKSPHKTKDSDNKPDDNTHRAA